MTEPTLSQDLCRCRHAASDHADGEGACARCARDNRSAWAALMRCGQFRWNGTWQPSERSA